MSTILYVHDDQTDPTSRIEALEAVGFEVTREQNARRCLALIQQHKPDLIVSDVLIHGMTGFEFCLQVRGLFPAEKLPIILCSGIYRGAAYREEALRTGTQSYAVEPFSALELVDEVQRVLGESSEASQAA